MNAFVESLCSVGVSPNDPIEQHDHSLKDASCRDLKVLDKTNQGDENQVGKAGMWYLPDLTWKDGPKLTSSATVARQRWRLFEGKRQRKLC